MIYKYMKYRDINDFITNIPKTKKSEDYSILFKCNGLDYPNNTYTNKCFGCLFCALENQKALRKFKDFWGDEFIKEYADKSFKGKPITLPNAKQCIKNPLKNLEFFTAVDETTNIQPWAAGILNHMCSKPNRTSMEVPVFNKSYERNGRLDVCSMTEENLIVIESKISLDESLRDERFIEQRHKYTVEIEKSFSNYSYLTLFGGKETDLFPSSTPYCTGKIGNKTDRFYSIVISNKVPFISATALWCLCCRYLEYGDSYAWDIFFKKLFSDSSCIGLLSSGKIINKNNNITMESF